MDTYVNGAASRLGAFNQGVNGAPEEFTTLQQTEANPHFHGAGVESIANTFSNVNGESQSTFGNPNASHGDPYAKAMQDQLRGTAGDSAPQQES